MRRCDKCSRYHPKHGFCDFDDTLTEPYETCLNWKPITNADHIRAMTDKELAKWFCDKVSCGCVCLALCKDCGRDDKSCTQAWLNWLKQEVMEDLE